MQRRAFSAICLIAALVLAPDSALAYSRQGHQAIAILAHDSPALKESARAAIDGILAGESVADAAEWPDAIKPPFGALSKTAEARRFLREHPEAHLWHFVNFPVGSAAYDANSRYATPTDIVRAIHGCIAVLEGTGDFDGLTKKEALRFLVHLVGDVHQPLHTVTGFFDVTNPARPRIYPAQSMPTGAFSDAGGNDLYVSNKKELHAMWDDDLVAAIVGSKGTEQLVAALTPAFSPIANRTAGDYHGWAERWASESMVVGAQAYEGLVFLSYERAKEGGRARQKIAVELPPGYRERQTEVERQQVLRAAEHLLQLWNAMAWNK